MRVDTGRLRVVAGEALEPVMTEDAGPPSPGAYIRHHRVRRGMSIEQLAIATKIPRSSLELLEEDRFEELPGMVFAKGFLRCCARSLGLEEDTVLGLLYEREREVRAAPREGNAPLVVPAPRAKTREAPAGALLGLDALKHWALEFRSKILAPRVLLWVLVTLFVILVVFLAFTIASGQGTSPART
jgi:transcriptional regulator with XRE-family HTH domain